MFKVFDSGLSPIGIDIGSHAVRLMQFRTTAGGLSLQAACRIELDSLDAGGQASARQVTAIRHAISTQNFSGRDVVVSLPTNSVHAKSVRLPQMPDSDLDQALKWEAKDRFGFEIGESGGQIVWFRAGEVRRGTEVKDELLLFAVEGGVLTGIMQELLGLRLNVRAVDLAPCATFRSVRRAAGAGTTPVLAGTGALLDIGHAGTQFMITRDEELVFYKHIDLGGKAVNEAIAAKLGITAAEAVQMRARLTTDAANADEAPLNQALRDAMRAPLEELARELDMCMRYYVVTFRGARPESIVATGRQAGCAQVRETLGNALNLQVEEAQPLRGVQNLGDVARPDRSSEWAIAAGLSLYPLHARARVEAAA